MWRLALGVDRICDRSVLDAAPENFACYDMASALDLFAEASAAAMGGICSTVILYPLEIVKNKMQAGERGSFSSIMAKVVKAQGAAGLYNGCTFSTCHSVLEKSIYFYAYATLRRAVEAYSKGEMGQAANIMVGYVCEWAHLPVTMPVDKVLVSVQMGRGRGSLSGLVREIHAEGGVGAFYPGWRAYSLLALKPAIQYTVFEQIKTAFLRSAARGVGGTGARAVTELSAFQAFALGGRARAIATVIMFPLIRAVKIRQASGGCTKPGESGGNGQQAKSSNAELGEEGVVSTMTRVMREDGALALYQGMGPEIGRGVLSSALMMMVKEKIYAANQAALYALAGKSPPGAIERATV